MYSRDVKFLLFMLCIAVSLFSSSTVVPSIMLHVRSVGTWVQNGFFERDQNLHLHLDPRIQQIRLLKPAILGIGNMLRSCNDTGGIWLDCVMIGHDLFVWFDYHLIQFMSIYLDIQVSWIPALHRIIEWFWDTTSVYEFGSYPLNLCNPVSTSMLTSWWTGHPTV